ncbi:MAG: glycosyltransferase family 4 protein [Leptospira sp.]|nr:glycosyltransferase family 4 protein [Leptospira sp.]
MNKLRVCQFSTGFHPGDAISQEMIAFDKYFKRIGFNSEIFAEHIGSAVKKIAHKYNRYKPEKFDVIVYHHSIHSNVLDWVLKQPCKKILIYHNVTPSHFFEPYDLQFSYLLSQGKNELIPLRDKFAFCLADSEFNRQELLDMGYQKVSVLPILYDFTNLDSEYVVRNPFSGIKIVFIGRISPNKKQDDLIRFAEVYRKFFRSDFQIQLVGYASPASKNYLEELEKLTRFYDLEEHIHLSGYVTQKELNGYYREADIFLSMSEHEGFCVPLLEAMYFQIPVLAYDAGAVADTMDRAGILFKQKDFPLLCSTIEEILSNDEFRQSILMKQNQRLTEFNRSHQEEILVRAIQDIES